MSSYKLNLKKSTGGEIIRTYSNNELFGYVIIESDEPIYDSVLTDLHLNFVNADKSKLPKKGVILRAKTGLLIKFVDMHKNKELPGRIRVIEYLENQIPETVQKAYLRDDIPFSEAILPYIKKFKYYTLSNSNKKEELITLKCNSKRIVQFKTYSPQNEGDVVISDYDSDVVQNFIDVFSEFIKEDDEIEIKENDSVLIRKIKEKKIRNRKDLVLSETCENYNVRICLFNNISNDSSDVSFIEVEEIINLNNVKKKRTALIFGSGSNLKEFIDIHERDGYLPGKIILHEYRESEIPIKYLRKTNYSKITSSVEYIKNNLKFKIKEDDFGKYIKFNNELIVIFYEYINKEDCQDIFVDLKINEIKDVNSPKYKKPKTKSQSQTSLELIRRKNRITFPIILMLLIGVIFLMVKVPSIFTVIAGVVGSLIIFFFVGAFYQAIFSKSSDFNLSHTILVGVLIIILVGVCIIIGEFTKTPHDPEMWRHP